MVNEANIQKFKARLRGELIQRGEPNNETARKIFIARQELNFGDASGCGASSGMKDAESHHYGQRRLAASVPQFAVHIIGPASPSSGVGIVRI